MNVDLLIKENKELIEEKQRYKDMWLTTNNSLAKYRDIEKQIGCPLEVVFNAVLRWIYYEDTNGNITRDFVDLHTNLDGEYVLLCENAREVFFTKDYKKTWFLKKDKSE